MFLMAVSMTVFLSVRKSNSVMVLLSVSMEPLVPKMRVKRPLWALKAVIVMEMVLPLSKSMLTTWLSTTSLSQA